MSDAGGRAVDTVTGEIVAALTAEAARDLTERLRTALSVSWELVKEAHAGRAWAALGYESWDAYCEAEFDNIRSLRLPREERTEIVASLRDAGFSIRAIAAVTGAAKSTVEADVSRIGTPAGSSESPSASSAGVEPDEEGEPGGVTPAAPAPPESLAAKQAAFAARAAQRVQGNDGKSYPAAKPTPKPAQRKALTDVAEKAGWDFRKAVERLERIGADDRFSANRTQVAAHLRGHLMYAVEVCQDLLDGFDHQSPEDR